MTAEGVDMENKYLKRLNDEYELLRRKLIFYFRRRDCSPPEEYADETLVRLFKNIISGKEIEDFDKFFYAIARNVARESWREPETVPIPDGSNQSNTDGQTNNPPSNKLPPELIETPVIPDKDVRKYCLRQSFKDLADDKRRLLLEFNEIEHGDDVALTKLCERFGIPVNLNKETNSDKFQALYTRLSRIRSTMRQLCLDCVTRELGNGSEITGERRKQMIEFLKTGKNKVLNVRK